MTNVFKIKQDMCEIGRRIYAKGFAAANDGNITVRINDNEVLCTPTMHCKGFLTPDDICTVDMTGKQTAGRKKRSSEALLHLEIYKQREDIRSVVHCHPPHATAFAVARAMDLASARGAKKTIPLPVSGAFHSSLMFDAKAGLADAVQALNFKEPTMPLVGNCDSRPLSTADEIRTELVNGLCQCVHWKDSVRHLVDSGVTQFVEFGSGGVLAGLIKRIDRGVKVSTVSDTASVQKLADNET